MERNFVETFSKQVSPFWHADWRRPWSRAFSVTKGKARLSKYKADGRTTSNPVHSLVANMCYAAVRKKRLGPPAKTTRTLGFERNQSGAALTRWRSKRTGTNAESLKSKGLKIFRYWSEAGVQNFLWGACLSLCVGHSVTIALWASPCVNHRGASIAVWTLPVSRRMRSRAHIVKKKAEWYWQFKVQEFGPYSLLSGRHNHCATSFRW